VSWLFALLRLGLTAAQAIVQGLVQWLSRRSPGEIVAIALALALIVDHVALLAAHRHNAKLQTQLGNTVKALSGERAGRLADRRTYAKAQSDAAAANKIQVAKVEQQYQRNSDDERQAYLADRARLHAGGVRGQTPSAASGAAGPARPSAPSAAASGADGADKLPLPPEELLRAQEIELQLMHLQSWAEKQIAIDPNDKP